MSLVNNILLRPHTFDTRARAVSPESDIASIVMDTVARILKDVRGDRAIITHLWELAQDGVNELLQKVIAQLSSSLDELKALVQPIMDFITAIAEAAGASDFGAGFVSVIGLLVDKIVDLSRNFSLDALEALLLRLAGIANRALGLTDGSLGNIVEGAVDHITEGLMAAFLGGDNSTPALDSFMIGNNIRRIKEYFKDFLQQQNISFDLTEPVKGIILELRKKGIDEKLRQIREYVETIGGGASFIGSLSGTLSISFNAPRTSGPVTIEDPVGWYATWFNSIWGGETIGVDDRFDVNTWRVAREGLSEPARADHPEDWIYFKDIIAFEDSNLTASVMEKVAHISYLAGDFVEALMHTISLHNRPYANSIVNIVTQAWKGALTTALGSNNDQSWVNAYKVLGNNWFDYATQIGLTTIFGWIPEANLTVGGNPLFYFLGIARSWGELSFIRNYVWLARELTLGSLTLRNTNRSLASSKDNCKKIFGLSHLIGDAGCWLGAWVCQRENFGINNGGFMGPIIAGFGIGVLTTTVGAGILAYAFNTPSENLVGHLYGQAGLICLFKSFLYWNIMWENNTDGGRYLSMPGYADNSDSPYMLPYENGLEKWVVQGNNGVFSHNNLTNTQTYAYDFTHDHRDEILAIRAGVVTSWGDGVGDDTHDGPNTIDIAHSGPVNQVHDVGASQLRGQTVSSYVHGAHAGVRHAFALYGIPASQIMRAGTTQVSVRQGQVVMLAGNTGNSGHNHLHLDVRLVSGGSTIPFVFKNVDSDGGVPKTNGYYTSTTPKVPFIADSNYPLYHPDRGSGNVVAITSSTLTVDTSGSPHGEWYDGCAIAIFTGNLASDVVTLLGYSMVTDYDSGSKKFTVSPDWQQIPSSLTTPAQVQYRVGSRPRSSSDSFEKRFGYWALYGDSFTAPYNPAAVAATFADGASNDKYARNNAYQNARATGGIISSTNNTVILNVAITLAPASVVGCFIAIQNPAGNIVGCSEILSYTQGTQTITIQGTWQIAPTNLDTFFIGGPTFALATGVQTDFTYQGNDTITTGAVVAATANSVTLAPAANLVPTEAIGSFIVIQRGGLIINYAQILSYDNGTKVVTIIGGWERPVLVGDTYSVRGQKFSTNPATPVPARYLSYPLNWP